MGVPPAVLPDCQSEGAQSKAPLGPTSWGQGAACHLRSHWVPDALLPLPVPPQFSAVCPCPLWSPVQNSCTGKAHVSHSGLRPFAESQLVPGTGTQTHSVGLWAS